MAIKCIIVGRDKIHHCFFMINNSSNDIPDIHYSAGFEYLVRKQCTPKIYESISQAKSVVAWLKSRKDGLRRRWQTETDADNIDKTMNILIESTSSSKIKEK